jgi:hypothetical protein
MSFLCIAFLSGLYAVAHCGRAMFPQYFGNISAALQISAAHGAGAL